MRPVLARRTAPHRYEGFFYNVTVPVPTALYQERVDSPSLKNVTLSPLWTRIVHARVSAQGGMGPIHVEVEQNANGVYGFILSASPGELLLGPYSIFLVYLNI